MGQKINQETRDDKTSHVIQKCQVDYKRPETLS